MCSVCIGTKITPQCLVAYINKTQAWQRGAVSKPLQI